MTDKGNSHADRLERALGELEAKKKAAVNMAASINPERERLAALNKKLEALPQSERRQVLDAMGLKHISAAPEPITPLKGSSYRPPNKPPEPLGIDWRDWRHMLEVEQWEACALSLNINPDTMKHSPQGWMAGPGNGPVFLAVSFPSTNVQLKFDKRLRLLGASLFKSPYFTAVNNLVMGGRHLATINLREFAAWGLHVELEGMPTELVAMAAIQSHATIPSTMHVVATNASDGVPPVTKPTAAPVVVAVLEELAKAGPIFNMTKASMVENHEHQWPTINRDIADASTNGLSSAKGGLRGWNEALALEWARANNKLVNASKPASLLTQVVNSMSNLAGRKHTL